MTNWDAFGLYVVFVAGCVVAGWLGSKFGKMRGCENDAGQRQGLGKVND